MAPNGGNGTPLSGSNSSSNVAANVTGGNIPPQNPTQNIYVNPTTIWPPPAYNGKSRFAVWEAQFEMFVSAAKITDLKMKALALLQHIGSDTFEKIMDWTAPKSPQDVEYGELIEIIREKCTKKPNLFALRVKFFNERQRPGQSLDEYFSHMTRLYGQCSLQKMTAENFGVLAFLKGIANDDTRQHLMTSSTEITTMAKVQELATNFEQGKAAAKEIKGDGGNASSKSYSINVVGKGMKCRYCGDNHQPGKDRCPAKDKTCSNCGKLNHFAKVCKSDTRKQQQNMVETCSSGRLNGIYGVLTVSSRHEGHVPPTIIEAKLDGTAVKMQHDSGSGLSIISKKVWHTIGEPKMYPSDVQLESYNQRITVIGQCKVTVQVGTELKQQWVVVVPKGESLFGRNWIHAFNVQMQRRCNECYDRKRGEYERKHTVNFVHHSSRRASEDLDRSSYWENKIMKEAVHDPMQGKEIGLSGKDMKQRNGRFSAQTTHAKATEDTVLKSIKLQKEKPCKFLTGKGRPRHPKQKRHRVSDQADLYFKRRMQHGKDTVAFANREWTSSKQDFTPTDGYGLKAFTGSNEANHHDRRTKILKNSSYKSGGADRYKFKLY